MDGDGRADIVWRSPVGLLTVWRLVGGSILESTPAPPPSDAEILGLADVDGDGRADLLWALADDNLVATPLGGGGDRWLGLLPSGRRVEGLADVDGDGRAELLLLAPGGILEVWTADPFLAAAGPGIPVPPGADLVGVGDMNGDGTDNLLWQYPDGRLEAWRIADGLVTWVPIGQIRPDQRVAGLADVDGDGQADLVLEAFDGTIEAWHLEGGSAVGAWPVGSPGGFWQVAMVGDLDGDGLADIVLRDRQDPAGAAMMVSPLAGGGLGGSTSLPPAVPSWQVVSSRPVPRLRFVATSISDPFLPTVADLDGDGWPDVLGGHNRGDGIMEAVAVEAIGLGAVLADGRAYRDARVADLNGDGWLDVIANTYSTVADPSRALLFFGNGDGTFTEDPEFAALDIRGYGETIVVADFDNDGDLDVYIPYYAFDDPAVEHCYLLINDGAGHFTDVADSAGVALRGQPFELRPEGAQAVDFDDDGWIDLYVASHLFHNNGDLTFTDVREVVGLPLQFEEGAKFLDWNADGRLDLVLADINRGPQLFEFDGSAFHARHAFAAETYRLSYGLNVVDLDGDGLEDVVSTGSGDCSQRVRIHLNTRVRFVPAAAPQAAARCASLAAAGDLDRDGRMDLVVTEFGPTGARLWTLLNRTPPAGGSFVVEVVGAGGERNQQGRVIRARPGSRSDFVMTRVVDGGSGYLSQAPYPVLFGTPFPEKHVIQVRFATGLVQVTVMPGETVRIGPTGRLDGPPGGGVRPQALPAAIGASRGGSQGTSSTTPTRSGR